MFMPLQSFIISLQHSISAGVGVESGMKHASCGNRPQTIATLRTSARNDHVMCKVYMESVIPIEVLCRRLSSLRQTYITVLTQRAGDSLCRFCGNRCTC